MYIIFFEIFIWQTMITSFELQDGVEVLDSCEALIRCSALQVVAGGV